MITTRFNPSVNGPLHLGHIYMALVNEAFAKERGGRFLVRWDDSHPLRIRSMGEKRTANILEGQRRDMDWLGFRPDEYIKQSDVVGEVRDRIRSSLPSPCLLDDEVEVKLPRLVSDDYIPLYSLAPTITIEKVIMDHDEKVTHLIRGVDLLSEYCLYQYYCRCLGIPRPLHIYLPRLKWRHGDMSKTMGAQAVSDLRNKGYTPENVRGILETACLRHAPNGWTLDNIKGAPCLQTSSR